MYELFSDYIASIDIAYYRGMLLNQTILYICLPSVWAVGANCSQKLHILAIRSYPAILIAADPRINSSVSTLQSVFSPESSRSSWVNRLFANSSSLSRVCSDAVWYLHAIIILPKAEVDLSLLHCILLSLARCGQILIHPTDLTKH